ACSSSRRSSSPPKPGTFFSSALNSGNVRVCRHGPDEKCFGPKNSSLDKNLFSTKFLGWKERFKVAIGTAKALAYLHHECLEWVIHCDVKPENILLHSEFEPKVADFGLAKLSQRGSPGSEFSRIRGTKGYSLPAKLSHRFAYGSP
ncbi:hypothetical protein U1Q18_037604, partial [Sarracenia purpurea var. burkii]